MFSLMYISTVLSSVRRSVIILGLFGAFVRASFYYPYAAKIIETYCTGIRANCYGVKTYYNQQ